MGEGNPRPGDTVPTPPAAQVVVQVVDRSPGLLIRAVWFVFVGWWLGQFALLAAWTLNVLIITLPLGLYILNRLPQVFTLRSSSENWRVEATGAGGTVIRSVEPEQRDFWLRALFFVFVGWWFSFIWMEIAWLAGITLILLPLSFWMFSKSAAITTLRIT